MSIATAWAGASQRSNGGIRAGTLRSNADEAFARALQQQHHQDAEHHRLDVALQVERVPAAASPSATPSARRRCRRRPPRPGHLMRTADDGHEEVVDTGVDVDRVRADEAQVAVRAASPPVPLQQLPANEDDELEQRRRRRTLRPWRRGGGSA
ncbi:MAG: hypothetical protein U1F67_23510 [Rubrivivax sp.]